MWAALWLMCGASQAADPLPQASRVPGPRERSFVVLSPPPARGALAFDAGGLARIPGVRGGFEGSFVALDPPVTWRTPEVQGAVGVYSRLRLQPDAHRSLELRGDLTMGPPAEELGAGTRGARMSTLATRQVRDAGVQLRAGVELQPGDEPSIQPELGAALCWSSQPLAPLLVTRVALVEGEPTATAELLLGAGARR